MPVARVLDREALHTLLCEIESIFLLPILPRMTAAMSQSPQIPGLSNTKSSDLSPLQATDMGTRAPSGGQRGPVGL